MKKRSQARRKGDTWWPGHAETDPQGSWTGKPEDPMETPVQDADDFPVEVVRPVEEVRDLQFARRNPGHVLVVEPEGLVLPGGELLERGLYLAAAADVVNPVAALLPLVVEIELGDGPAVERVLAPLELLRAVDMPETHEVKVCRRQRVGINDRFKLTEKSRLPALHVAARDGVVRYQHRRGARLALCLEADNHVRDGLGEYLVFLLLGEAGVLRPVIPPVESGEASGLHPAVCPTENFHHLRLRDDFHLAIALECGLEHFKLLLAVVVRSTPHHNHRANGRKLPQELHRRLLLLEAPVAPYPRLMEDVARDYRDARLLFSGPLHQCVEALADVEVSRVFPVLLRAGEVANMEVARM